VLLGETIMKDWTKKDPRASEVLDYARLRRFSTARQEKLL
jgi:type III restriction enzyme